MLPIKRSVSCLLVTLLTLLLITPPPCPAQLQIYTPAAPQEYVASAADYATDVFNNPWDMDSRNDLAEFIPFADYASNVAHSFNNGVLSFDIPASGSGFFHLISPGQKSINPLGKNGQRFPIDSTKYRYLNIRLKTDTADFMIIHWNTGKEHSSKYVRTTLIPTSTDWKIYNIDLETVGISQRINETRSWSQANQITGLRIDPGGKGHLDIDWITLTGDAPALFPVNYVFTPQGSFTRHSLFIDDDDNLSNGYQQALVLNAAAAQTVSIDPKLLFPGTYQVCGYMTNPSASVNSATVCSPGDLIVNQPPLLRVLQPDALGGEDFAAAVLGNPWNMDSMNDLSSTTNLKNTEIVNGQVVNGKSGDFFCATNTTSDPIQELLAVAVNSNKRINASRYRNISVEAYIQGKQDIVNGSVMRIIGWNQARDAVAFNGDDTIVQSQDSNWFKLTQDMTKFKLEPLLHPPGSLPDPVWSGYINMFRVDIHEFTQARRYCVNSIEVRADDEANTQFALAFDAYDSDSSKANVSISFYYSASETTSGGTPIVTNLSMDQNSRVYLWDTSGVPDGTYWIYAVASDGYNTGTRLGHRIVIDHSRPQDSTKPVVQLNSPASGTPIGATLQVRGYAIDNVQVALVEILVNDTLIGTLQPALFNENARSAYPSYADASSAGFNETFIVPTPLQGSTQLIVRAWDTAGNQATQDYGDGAAPKLRTRLNRLARSLKIRIRNVSLCSQLDLVGHRDKSSLASGITLKSFSSGNSFNLTATRLKSLRKRGNGPLWLGLNCDGSLAVSRKINVTSVPTRKKIRTWQKYLRFLKRRLR